MHPWIGFNTKLQLKAVQRIKHMMGYLDSTAVEIIRAKNQVSEKQVIDIAKASNFLNLGRPTPYQIVLRSLESYSMGTERTLEDYTHFSQ